jgi:hypothetical protein
MDDTWEQPWGERRFIRNHYNELRVALTETGAPNRRLDMVFRLYDDGLGFRYEVPEQPGLKTVNIGPELTEFNLAENGTAWWIPAWEWNREEYLYNRTAIDEVGVLPDPDHGRTDRPACTSRSTRPPASTMPACACAARRATKFRAAVDPRPDQRRRRPADRPLRHPMAHHADRRQRRRPGHLQPDPEPERAERAGRRQLVQADEIRRRLVGNAPRHKTWASGPKHGATTENVHQTHRLRRRKWLRRRAGRGLEQGLGRGLVRQRLGLQLHRDLSRFRHRADRRLRPPEGRRDHRPPRNRRQRLPLRTADRRGLRPVRAAGLHSVKTGYVADAGKAPACAAPTVRCNWRGTRASPWLNTTCVSSRPAPVIRSRSTPTSRSRTPACAARIRT